MIILRQICLVSGLLALLGACAGPQRDTAENPGGRVGPRVADAMLRAGDAAAALRVADGMIEADPRDIEARAQRGRALLALGRPGEAADELATVARARPDDASGLSLLAAARAANGEAPLAETAWRAVLVSRPTDRQARIGLAIALDLQERHAEAQARYRDVLRERPDDVTASADLGLSLALSGQPRQALAYLEPAGTVPANPATAATGAAATGASRARHNLAVALILAGEEARARSVLSQDMSQSDISVAIESVRALRPS